MCALLRSDSSEENSGAVMRALEKIIAYIPSSGETPGNDPVSQARTIAAQAARRAAAISGALAIPPGPLGWLTILPDLIAIWHVQRQMVVDIATVLGKQASLNKRVMVYCLFKHGAAAAMRDMVVRTGQRLLVREVSLQAMQKILQRVGVRVSQRMLGEAISRWLPFVGAVGMGAYAYYDTRQVGKTALAFFMENVEIEGVDVVPPPPPLPPA